MPAGTKYSVVANTEMCCWFFKIEHGNGRTTLINSAVPMSRPCPGFPMDLIPPDERRRSVPIFYMDREVTLDSPDIQAYRARYPSGYQQPKPCLDPEKMNGYCDQWGGDEYVPEETPIPLTRLSKNEQEARDHVENLLLQSTGDSFRIVDQPPVLESSAFVEMKRQRNAAVALLRVLYAETWNAQDHIEQDAKIETFFESIGEKL